MNLQHLFDLATRQFVQLTALIAVTGLVMPLLARRRSHLAYVLWLAVLIKSLTPPVWSSPIGIFSFDGKQLACACDKTRYSTGFRHPAPHCPYPQPGRRFNPAKFPLRMVGRSPRLAMATWAIGCAGFTLFIVIRWIVLQRQMTRSSVETPREMSDMLSDLRRKLGVRRRIGLRICDDPIGPAMIGIFRPVLVIPRAILHEKTTAQLRPLVAHEIIHLRRGDPLVAALATHQPGDLVV